MNIVFTIYYYHKYLADALGQCRKSGRKVMIFFYSEANNYLPESMCANTYIKFFLRLCVPDHSKSYEKIILLP